MRGPRRPAVLLLAATMVLTVAGCQPVRHRQAPPSDATASSQATTTTTAVAPAAGATLTYDELEQKPRRFVATATVGLHVGGGTADNVAQFLVAEPEGTIDDGSEWDGLPYYRVAAYNETEVTVALTDGSDEITATTGSFEEVLPGDPITADGIEPGTTIVETTSDTEATISAPATTTGDAPASIRWPAIMGERIPPGIEGVVRLTDQGDPAINGTFEIFTDSHGVEGLYCVRTVWWNGLHNDAIDSLSVKRSTPFTVDGAGIHADELWLTGDGMDSDSRPVRTQGANVKVDASSMTATNATDAQGAFADLDAAIAGLRAARSGDSGTPWGAIVAAVVAVAIVAGGWWSMRRRLEQLESELRDLRSAAT